MRKSKKAKAHIPSNRMGKKTVEFLSLRTPATGPRLRISKRGNGGGNFLHLVEHFLCFPCYSCGRCVYFSHCFLSFCSLAFCYAVLISHLRFFFFFLVFISLPWASFFLPFSLSLSSTLCIIIHGLFCFDLYALVDRVFS